MTLLARTAPHPNSKLLATQWLALYQQGPKWVPPLVHAGALANLYLAFLASHHHYQHQHHQATQSTALHLAAALATLALLPLTFAYFEPGVNGACKWKVERLLVEDGFRLSPPAATAPARWKGVGVVVRRLPVSVRRHSATEGAKRWAEAADMRELVLAWAARNHVRWVMGLVAGVLSSVAMRTRGGVE
ncbi:uncharacterized protein THITE_46397 [Thermothielavioides terrestris NRRL 8126]|jgi:hypothetical protein|uniref:Uncharacterized protein n=1 Tax=Thermothielavioides terrestris (strain ATCC 38088 / NRRL 8126) TaxID=578455 RepID=G2RD99_THETT|nr:uncharacterized protein THITE_46397 [Thermothielavioides terrestris NRRL 8126]AEO70738.1 hypothetical protein THITE_46397 [Thermothielavioides terrestris NRRL 8126]